MAVTREERGHLALGEGADALDPGGRTPTWQFAYALTLRLLGCPRRRLYTVLVSKPSVIQERFQPVLTAFTAVKPFSR